MKRIVYIFIAVIFFCTSCAKEVLQTTYVDLGKKTVGVEAGSFPVKVTTEGVWYAESQSSWITVDGSLHDSDGTFLISYDSNASIEGDWRFNRIGTVYVKTYDGATTAVISVWQKGITPVIGFAEVNKIPVAGGLCKIPCTTNLTDAERNGISLSCNVNWISGLEWGRDGRSITFAAEAGAQGREATIKLVHTDAWGIATEALCTISQED